MRSLLLFTMTFLSFQVNAQFTETAQFVALDRTIDSELGIDVGIDGNFAIGGAYRHSLDENGSNSLNEAGAAYIFENDGNDNWIQIQKLVASDREAFAAFGLSVAISGNYAVVGAQLEDKDANGGDPINNAGAAYIFERQGNGNWLEVQKIVSSTRTSAGSFGIVVKIEGTTIIVGSHLDSTDEDGNNFMGQSGAAFSFERDGNGTWNQTQKIVAIDRGGSDNFGIDLFFKGNDAIIGANFDSQDASGNVVSASGSAYIFAKDGDGTWNHVQKIVSSDRTVNDRFGEDVSIDDNTVVVGARLHDNDASGGNSLTDAGAAYIFERDGTGTWSEIKKIVASDRANTDVFGFSVSIDGDYIAVGARLNDFDETGDNFQNNAGAAYIFERNSEGSNNWGQTQKIVTSDRSNGDRFANELVLKNGRLISSSAGQDQDDMGNNSISNAGKLYVFEDPALSVSHQDLGMLVKIYPNPFNDFVTVELGRFYEAGEIYIINILGQTVYSETFSNADTLILNLNIDSGLYLTTVNTSIGYSSSAKIIKE